MKIGICRFCKEEKPLIKAHIISKNLFKAIFNDYGKVHYVPLHDLDKRNKVQDAYYDTAILCHDCDNKFSPYENYFQQFLSGKIGEHEIFPVEKISYPEYQVDRFEGVNLHNIRMFFVIMLWRSGITQQNAFKDIQLGELQEELFEQIKSGVLTSYDKTPVVLLSVKRVDDVRTQ